MSDINQSAAVYELVAAPAADLNRIKGKIAIVNAAGTAGVAATDATVIASLPATGNAVDTVAVKLNAVLVALRAAGITKAS
jgi:hypothetical protein